MHIHTPSCLEGPLSGTREWWRTLEGNNETQSTAREPLFRAALVDQVRREIAAGTYDTEDKWESALDRLLLRLEAEEA